MHAVRYQQAVESSKDVNMSDSVALGATESPMDVDQQPASQSLKRKAEDPLNGDDAKKTKSDAPLKRYAI